MNRSSKSFEAQKKLIIDKATVILQGQRELMKIYAPTQDNQQEDQLQLVFNRITQGFTRAYEEHNEEKSTTNFEEINKYLDELAKGNLKSANLKLLRYYGKTNDFENSSKIVERIIPSSVKHSQTPSQTNEAKISIANNIDLTNINNNENLMDLLDYVSADHTVTGLILQRKNLSEMTRLLNNVLIENLNLTRLDLSGNQITAAQLQPLIKSLKRHPDLRELILDNNLLKDAGVSLLLPMIRKNLVLEFLSLNNNEISQRGGALLFGALAKVCMREDASFKLTLHGNKAQELFDPKVIKNIFSERIVVHSDSEIISARETIPQAINENIKITIEEKKITEASMNIANNFLKKEIDNSIKIISQEPFLNHRCYTINSKAVDISILASAKENGAQKGFIMKKIFSGEDVRIKIDKIDLWPPSNSWPYSAQGIVFMKFPSTKSDTYEWGSGTLIAPNVVLTAAHNLYDYRTNQEATEVRFLPAVNGQSLFCKEPEVVKYYFPEGYKTSKKDGFSLDYGILVLDDQLGHAMGHFCLESIAENVLKTKTINITGYPADKVEGKDRYYEMWSMSGPVKDIKDGMIHYEIDTYEGMNGSGVWYQNEEDFHVVGVHVGGDKALGINYAVLLTLGHYNQIINWIKECTLEKMSRITWSRKSFAVITTLDLSSSRIGYIMAQFLTSDLFPALTQLNLYNCGINSTGAIALAQNTTLTQLNLESNNIDSLGAQALALNTTLTQLNLKYNDIDSAGAQALALNNTLTQLDLCGNKIGGIGVQALAKNNTRTKLDLSYNDSSYHNRSPYEPIGDSGVQAFAQNTTITELSLANSKFSEVGLIALARNTTLTKLDLRSSELGTFKIQVWQAFAQNSTLKQLILQWIRIYSPPVVALAQNNSITALDLSSNYIDCKGAEALAQNTTLTDLMLYKNNIGDAGAIALAKNTILIKLYLSENNIGDAGSIALAKNTTLITLSLSHNNIGDAGAIALAQNTTLTKLTVLYHSRVGEAGEKALLGSVNPMIRNAA